MPRLTIDNRKISVAPGTKVIKAAEKLGIVIPRFCFHPALGSVGACRMCAVSVIEGPVSGIQMSCMLEAKDDMVISTTDEAAVAFRRSVIEWLMKNHPHDCPVCDEGGHCLLQDLTVSGGHSLRRFQGPKRTYDDQDLGPLLQHEMNRCIHCYRCVRFYQQFCGYYDLGVLGIGSRTYFGRHQDGALENPFSGNLSDICPTGVFTDKPSCYSGRRWDFERKPSVCIQCGLGCNTVVSARYRQVRRQEARFNGQVNGHFICDRGRYGFYYTSAENRPRVAKIDGQPAATTTATAEAKKRLAEIVAANGAVAVAVSVSSRSSLETYATLKEIVRKYGWQSPAVFNETKQADEALAMVQRLEPDLAISMQQIPRAEVVVVLGVDPLNEAPMLALALRQAQLAGAKVLVVDPRPVSLPFSFTHLALNPDDLVPFLAALTRNTVSVETASRLGVADCLKAISDLAEGMSESAEKAAAQIKPVLDSSKMPLLVCGTELLQAAGIHLAADLGLFLRAMGKNGRLFFVNKGANAFGAGLMGAAENSFEKVLEEIEKDRVKGLVMAEADFLSVGCDRPRVEAAFEKLDLLVVIDYLESVLVDKADIFLPAATVYESGGSFINQEGRRQEAAPVMAGGTPVLQTGSGDHPPRNYQEAVPGADQLAVWQALAAVAGFELPADSAARKQACQQLVENAMPQGQVLAETDPIQTDQKRDGLGPNPLRRFNARRYQQLNQNQAQKNKKPLSLLRVEWNLGTEQFSAYAPCLKEITLKPAVFMQAQTATELNLTAGENVSISTELGTLTAPLKTFENMAAAVVVLPRHHDLNWQVLGPGEIRLDPSQISKA